MGQSRQSPEDRTGTFRRLTRQWSDRADAILGGPGRARVVGLLAGVLALNSADAGTIGAAAAQLEADLGISHAQLGLLATASSGVGAVAAVPMGAFADRLNRVHLLTVTVGVWAVAMVAGGLATDYHWLLISRLLLGTALAASGPVVVSLTGDFVPPAERAGVLGWILTGEILGAGIGLIAGGEVSAALSWRYAFFLLAAASLGLTLALWRLLPEPRRGGGSWFSAHGTGSDRTAGQDRHQPEERPADRAREVIAAQSVEPDPSRLPPGAGTDLPLWRAARYLLTIPSNRLLILASALGYFFFAGLRTFAVLFAVRHYGISQAALGGLVPVIGAAALAGAAGGGRFSDWVLNRGRADARIIIPAAGYLGAAVLFAPGVALTSAALALPAIALGTAALAAANPALDAARLDIVPGSMWGRAESLRMVLRLAAEAAAPAVFGLMADLLGGRATGQGLRDTFLVMLLPLLGSGILMLRVRHSYPVDVATAAKADQRQPG